MFQFIKKNYKILLIVLCIIAFLVGYQQKKMNEIDLTKISSLQQLCDILNLPIEVVYPAGAVDCNFSSEVRLDRGFYTVTFKPYVYTIEDYDIWVSKLEEESRKICIGGILVNHSRSIGGSDFRSTTWYITQHNAPDANVKVYWSDGDIEDDIGILRLVFEMY